MIRTARDWLLKRFLKFLLKRSLGRYLRTDLDLEQLELKLDIGCLELKNVLIDCDAVNADLVRVLGFCPRAPTYCAWLPMHECMHVCRRPGNLLKSACLYVPTLADTIIKC